MRLGPAMRAGLAAGLVGRAIAADEAGRNAEEARAGDEDMGEIARLSAPKREGLHGRFGIVRRVGVEAHRADAASPISRCMASSGSDAPAVASAAKSRSAPLSVRERTVAQIHLRRQPLDGAAHDARRVGRLDFAARPRPSAARSARHDAKTWSRCCRARPRSAAMRCRRRPRCASRATYWLSKPCGVSRRFWISMRAAGA